jgi:murein DD-endopeptidase MepM/ murein hydrolase activator NlpD
MRRKHRFGLGKRLGMSITKGYHLFFPEKHPGRPGSHPLSKMIRPIFEHKRAGRAIGALLALLVLSFGFLSNLFIESTQATEVALISQPGNQVITLTTLAKPLDGRLAQGFHGFHRGIDILDPVGTPILPISDGSVTEVSFGRLGWGNTVVVEHADGLSSRYAHMKDIKIIVGEKVTRDQTIGTVGLTGWTTGPHLHLEVYQSGRAIDPAAILPAFTSPDQAIAQAK